MNVALNYLHINLWYFNISFYDLSCKGMRSQSHMPVYGFCMALDFNRSDDGLVGKPKLVT
jgi:hypothetical protein